MLYFDHAASAPLASEVLDFLAHSNATDFANPASKHKLGTELAKKIENSRESILKNFGSNHFKLIFTSSATESNNQVIHTFLDAHHKEESKNSCDILYMKPDHPSITMPLTSQSGFFSLDDLVKNITEQTKLVALTHVNSQSGSVLDIVNAASEIKKINPQVKILVDASQSVTKIPFPSNLKDIDYITISSHKIGGPRGVAALIYKKDAPLKSLIQGGGHEYDLRSSTPATSLILAFAKAVELGIKNLNENYQIQLKNMSYLKEELLKLHKNISLPFEDDSNSPYILCVQFKGISSDILLRHLEMKEVYISSTTACSSKISGFNPILHGLGIDEKFHKNILRISIGHHTSLDECEKFIKSFSDMVREISFLIK